MTDQREIPHRLAGKFARFAWSVHLRPASQNVPRCVSQVMPTVVRIVLNLISSITGLLSFMLMFLFSEIQFEFSINVDS